MVLASDVHASEISVEICVEADAVFVLERILVFEL